MPNARFEFIMPMIVHHWIYTVLCTREYRRNSWAFSIFKILMHYCGVGNSLLSPDTKLWPITPRRSKNLRTPNCSKSEACSAQPNRNLESENLSHTEATLSLHTSPLRCTETRETKARGWKRAAREQIKELRIAPQWEEERKRMCRGKRKREKKPRLRLYAERRRSKREESVSGDRSNV